MIIVVERPVAETFALLLAVKHHLSGTVIIPESQIVMINGILFHAGDRVCQIQTHRHMVRNQNLVLRHHETLRLQFHGHLVVLPEKEHRLVVDTAKHIHLIAHHADTALKINIFHQILNRII